MIISSLRTSTWWLHQVDKGWTSLDLMTVQKWEKIAIFTVKSTNGQSINCSRILVEMYLPHRIWDKTIESKVYVHLNTAHNIIMLETEVPKTVTSSKTITVASSLSSAGQMGLVLSCHCLCTRSPASIWEIPWPIYWCLHWPNESLSYRWLWISGAYIVPSNNWQEFDWLTPQIPYHSDEGQSKKTFLAGEKNVQAFLMLLYTFSWGAIVSHRHNANWSIIDNPILDRDLYNAEFANGKFTSLTANSISKSVYASTILSTVSICS